MGDLWLCGWRVRCDLPMPDLWRWQGDERRPDVEIRLGNVPELSGPLALASAQLQIATDGRCRLEIPGVARYLILEGCQIVVEPKVNVASSELRLFLLGAVLGILCHQRGLFPLHASCLEIDGVAVALSGPSGSGKSTLAASLVHRGHTLLADDVCVVAPYASNGPTVLPAFPLLRLSRESLDLLGLAPEELEGRRAGLEKYPLYTDGAAHPPPAPKRLGCLLSLGDFQAEPVEAAVRVRGFEAVLLLLDHVYHGQPARALGRERALFEGASRLSQQIPFLRLARRRTPAGLVASATLIEELVRRLEGRTPWVG